MGPGMKVKMRPTTVLHVGCSCSFVNATAALEGGALASAATPVAASAAAFFAPTAAAVGDASTACAGWVDFDVNCSNKLPRWQGSLQAERGGWVIAVPCRS